MKRIFYFLSIIVTLFCSVAVYSQTPQKLKTEEEPWRVLEKARLAYKSGNYGDALRLSENAKQNRIAQCEWYTYVLNSAFHVSSIQHAGDDIEKVLAALQEDGLRDAKTILDYFVNMYSAEYFNNSVAELRAFAENRRDYPEAEYLIGKVYQIEGEYDFAYRYYDKAWKLADKLDVPDEKYDILYSMADLAIMTGNEDRYEKTLLLVLNSDKTFMDAGFSNSFSQVLSRPKSMSPDRFFQMYRSGNVRSVLACYKLSEFYADHGEKSKSLTMLAYGMIAATNHISTIISDRDSDYKYTTLRDFFVEISKYSDIVQWGIDNGVWEHFYDFALKVSELGNENFSQNLFLILSECEPEEYWRTAAKKLVKR